MVPIEGSRRESLARWVNAQDVYWADSTGRRNTLRAVIAVDDGLVWSRVAVGDGHAKGVSDQWGGLVAVDRPADHPAGEHIQDHTAGHRALSGRVLGDVGDPQLVWGRPVEAALDQISSGRPVGLAAEGLPWSWQPA